MLHQLLTIPPTDTHARDMAEHAGLTALLRAFCREIAEPHGLMRLERPPAGTPMPAILTRSPFILGLDLSDDGMLMVGVEDATALHNYRPCTPFFLREGRRHRLLDWREIARRLYTAAGRLTGAGGNVEILDQTANSIAVTQRLLDHRLRDRRHHSLPRDATRAWLRSEGNLLFGHATHPTPKSREGVDLDSVVRHAPETGQPFDLHYFAVDRDHLLCFSADETPAEDRLGICLPDQMDGPALPVHPIQAERLRRMPAVRRALTAGWLRDLGAIPKPYHATSSVRTVAHGADPFCLKLSLGIRLTNCIRKNTAYELEGAVALTRLLTPLAEGWARRFPHFHVLAEPAALSVDAPHFEKQDRTALIEGFGLILRQSVLACTGPGEVPLVAGGLFSPPVDGIGWLAQIVPPGDTEDWFDAYLDALIPPILGAWFRDGIAFEPHLQNCIVGLRDGRPSSIQIRDLEGTKLTARAPRLDGIGDTTREALTYSEDAGWARVAYCLFVNHLGEAIHQLAGGSAMIELRLWDRVADALDRYQQTHGCAASAERLVPLSSGEPLPAKALLLTRFRRLRDREAGYVPLANPMRARG